MPLRVGLHTWAVTACGGMSIGDKGSLDSARVMAGAGFDLMTNAALRKAVRADFEARTKGRKYVSPLHPERRRPEGIPEHLLLRDGTGEFADPLYRGI